MQTAGKYMVLYGEGLLDKAELGCLDRVPWTGNIGVTAVYIDRPANGSFGFNDCLNRFTLGALWLRF